MAITSTSQSPISTRPPAQLAPPKSAVDFQKALNNKIEALPPAGRQSSSSATSQTSGARSKIENYQRGGKTSSAGKNVDALSDELKSTHSGISSDRRDLIDASKEQKNMSNTHINDHMINNPDDIEGQHRVVKRSPLPAEYYERLDQQSDLEGVLNTMFRYNAFSPETSGFMGGGPRLRSTGEFLSYVRERDVAVPNSLYRYSPILPADAATQGLPSSDPSTPDDLDSLIPLMYAHTGSTGGTRGLVQSFSAVNRPNHLLPNITDGNLYRISTRGHEDDFISTARLLLNADTYLSQGLISARDVGDLSKLVNTYGILNEREYFYTGGAAIPVELIRRANGNPIGDYAPAESNDTFINQHTKVQTTLSDGVDVRWTGLSSGYIEHVQGLDIGHGQALGLSDVSTNYNNGWKDINKLSSDIILRGGSQEGTMNIPLIVGKNNDGTYDYSGNPGAPGARFSFNSKGGIVGLFPTSENSIGDQIYSIVSFRKSKDPNSRLLFNDKGNHVFKGVGDQFGSPDIDLEYDQNTKMWSFVDGSKSRYVQLPSSAPHFNPYPTIHKPDDDKGGTGGTGGSSSNGATGYSPDGATGNSYGGGAYGYGEEKYSYPGGNSIPYYQSTRFQKNTEYKNINQFIAGSASSGPNGRFDAIEHIGRQLFEEKTVMQMIDTENDDSKTLVTGYPIEHEGTTRYGLTTYYDTNYPRDRFNPIDRTVSLYDASEVDVAKRWKEDKAGTFIARMGGGENVARHVMSNAELQSKAPTVVNAISLELDKMDLSHRDYTIKFTHRTLEEDGYIPGPLGNVPKSKIVTHTKSMSLADLIVNRNHYSGLELKEIQRNDKMPSNVDMQIDEGKIRSYIVNNKLDLQATQTAMQNEFYNAPENQQLLKQYYQDFPLVEAEKARQLGLGGVTDEAVDMIKRAQVPGSDVTRSLISLPSVDSADAADLVLYQDGSGRSILQGYQRTGFSGSSTVAFNTEAELNNWLSRGENKELLKPYFNLWSRQDGVRDNGVDTELASVQGLDAFTLTPVTTQESLNEQLIERRRKNDEFNADAMIYSNAEWNTKLATDIAKPIILLGSLAAAPFTGGSSLAIGGLLSSIPYGIQAFTSDFADERRSNLIGFGLSLATAGLPVIGKAVKGVGGGLLTTLGSGASRVSQYARGASRVLSQVSQQAERIPLLKVKVQ